MPALPKAFMLKIKCLDNERPGWKRIVDDGDDGEKVRGCCCEHDESKNR